MSTVAGRQTLRFSIRNYVEASRRERSKTAACSHCIHLYDLRAWVSAVQLASQFCTPNTQLAEEDRDLGSAT